MALTITPAHARVDHVGESLDWSRVQTVPVRASTYTALDDNSGLIHDVYEDCVITLPAVNGAVFWFRAVADNIDITLSPNASDRIMGGGDTAADDKDIQMLDCKHGDWIGVIGCDADGYSVSGLRYTGASTVTYLA